MSAATQPEAMTFEAAIDLTQTWLDQWAAGAWTPEQFVAAVAPLVTTPAGARGFFVVYLTDDRPLVDHPPEGLVAALAQAPAIVLDLLVKNLAMSAAMAITHDRAGDAAMAERSRHTSQRSGDLLNHLDRYFTDTSGAAEVAGSTGAEPAPSVTALLDQLRSSITDQTGPFVAFLERWGYDEVQRRAILRAIEHRGSEPGSARAISNPA
ncbi:MAG TPA: hypothetical protein V6D46_06165 [Coleofasciculaceae cyanobacterium]